MDLHDLNGVLLYPCLNQKEHNKMAFLANKQKSRDSKILLSIPIFLAKPRGNLYYCSTLVLAGVTLTLPECAVQ